MAKFKPLSQFTAVGAQTPVSVKKEEEQPVVPATKEQVKTVVTQPVQKQKSVSIPPKEVAQQATAAKEASGKEYDEEDTYVGLVEEILEKPERGISIFKIKGPCGFVQAYSNAMSKATKLAIGKGAQVRFTPSKEEGKNGSFFVAVDVTVLAQDPRQSLLAGIVAKFKGLAFSVPETEVLPMLNPEEDVDKAIMAIQSTVNGEIIAHVSGNFIFWGDTKK